MLYQLRLPKDLLRDVAIGLLLVVAAIRARFFGAPVYRVEEELGLGEGLHVSEPPLEKAP